MIAESCFSLHESSPSKVDSSDNVNFVVYQTQRALGRGVDMFDANGIPQTPAISAASRPAPSESLVSLDSFDSGASALAGAVQSGRHPLVLVRGGTSFQGAHIVLRLLQEGYYVRVLARECPAHEIQEFMSMVHRYVANARLFVFQGDDLADAVSMCEFVVWHTDPPLLDASSSEEILQRHLDDIQDLFLSIHNAHVSAGVRQQRGKAMCSWTGVQRVILLTSAATIFPVDTTSRTRERISLQAKAQALHEAERISKRSGIPIVVLLLSVVVGPPLTLDKSEALYTIAKIAKGNRWLQFAPKIRWNYVDVRDVAEACRAALTSPVALNQRYLITNGEWSVSEVGRIVKHYFPKLQPPLYNMPNGLTLLLSMIGLLGERVSYQYLRSTLGHSHVLSNVKAQRELQMSFRDPRYAILEVVENMLEATDGALGDAFSPQSSMTCSLADGPWSNSLTVLSSSGESSPRRAESRRKREQRRNRQTAILIVGASLLSLGLGYCYGIRSKI